MENMKIDHDKFFKIFFRRLRAKSNWTVDQLMKEWVFTENEIYVQEIKKEDDDKKI